MAERIVWTIRARKSFNRIISFLEEEWGERVTANFVRRAYDIIELLAEHPSLGSLEKADEQIRGFPITEHNRLFYRVTEDGIILLNFFDTRSGKRRKKF